MENNTYGNSTGTCLSISDDHNQVRNSSFNNCSLAIDISGTGAHNNTVSNNTITNSANGIKCQSAAGGIISNNSVDAGSGNAISASQSGSLVVSGNRVSSANNNAIYISSSDGAVLIGNNASGIYNGIVIYLSSNVRLINNTMWNCTLSGVA